VKATAQTIADSDPEGLERLIARVEQTLEDLRLQAEIFSAIEGLLPQLNTTRHRVDQAEFGTIPLSAEEDEASSDEFYEQVRAALRHYWGGPGMSRSRLIDLKTVQQAMTPGDPPTHALRTVIQQAIEKQRPDGERSLTSPEWTIYNILTLRFLEGKKVRDVARRMSMSEADLYRKQRLAIEAVSTTLHDMESEAAQPT
jgi:hypothetical protein